MTNGRGTNGRGTNGRGTNGRGTNGRGTTAHQGTGGRPAAPCVADPGGPTVTSVDVSTYTVPTDGPEADGTLVWDSTTLLVVEPVAAGVRGLGWSYTTAGAAAVVRDLLSPTLVGRDVCDIPGAVEAMNRAVRNVGRAGVAGTAISACDIALWDLKGRILGRSVAELLGRTGDGVEVYGSGGFTTYDDDRTRRQIEHWVGGLGARWVKIKIGQDRGRAVDRDLHRIGVARAAAGPDVGVFVDANGSYSPAQAVRVGRWAVDEHEVTWFEEPVTSDAPDQLAAVRRQVPCDVAAGEYVWTPYDAARLCAAGAVDCLQLDATRCGGISGFLSCAAVAAAHGLQVSGHCAPSVHAVACLAVAHHRHLEYFHDHARIEHLLFDGAPTARAGRLVPDLSRPGLGVELRRADAEPYRVG